VDSRDFVEPPGAKLVGIGIALIGLIVVWSIAYLFLFIRTSAGVSNALDTIIENRQVSSFVTEPSSGDSN